MNFKRNSAPRKKKYFKKYLKTNHAIIKKRKIIGKNKTGVKADKRVQRLT
jgi:hypothetical protein